MTAAFPVFGGEIVYAMLQKIYGVEQPLGEVRHSPAVFHRP